MRISPGFRSMPHSGCQPLHRVLPPSEQLPHLHPGGRKAALTDMLGYVFRPKAAGPTTALTRAQSCTQLGRVNKAHGTR